MDKQNTRYITMQKLLILCLLSTATGIYGMDQGPEIILSDNRNFMCRFSTQEEFDEYSRQVIERCRSIDKDTVNSYEGNILLAIGKKLFEEMQSARAERQSAQQTAPQAAGQHAQREADENSFGSGFKRGFLNPKSARK